jgi:hypothetical protein
MERPPSKGMLEVEVEIYYARADKREGQFERSLKLID